MTKKQGQSLTEYSLVIGLVALASIAGIAVLATNIQQNMTEAVAQESLPVSTNPTMVSQNLSAPNTLVSAGQMDTRLAGNTSVPVENLCISGICASFPVINKANELVDVAAGEGAEMIHQFANTFEELAASLEKDPNHDPQLAALIRGLALNGHDLGDKQTAVLDLKSPKVTVGSNAATQQVGYQNSKKSFDNTWDNIERFMTNHPDRVPSGVNDILNLQKTQIDRLYDGIKFESAGKGSVMSNILQKPVSLIHQNANTICGQQDKTTCMRPIQTQETAGNP